MDADVVKSLLVWFAVLVVVEKRAKKPYLIVWVTISVQSVHLTVRCSSRVRDMGGHRRRDCPPVRHVLRCWHRTPPPEDENLKTASRHSAGEYFNVLVLSFGEHRLPSR